MNNELITLNEIKNNGSQIYFYEEEISSIWTTWGYSAYLLSNIDEIKCLANFSKKMQMPCAYISNADFQSIVRDNQKNIENYGDFYLLQVNAEIDQNAYHEWVASLK